MKKSDVLLLALAMIAIGVVMRDRFLPPSKLHKLVNRQGIQLLAVTRENDCIDCLEKMICSFDEISEKVSGGRLPVSSTLLFASRDGESFPVSELNYLCQPPQKLVLCDFEDLFDVELLPAVTPALILIQDGRIIAQETIFVPTDMQLVGVRFNDTLDNLGAFMASQVGKQHP